MQKAHSIGAEHDVRSACGIQDVAGGTVVTRATFVRYAIQMRATAELHQAILLQIHRVQCGELPASGTSARLGYSSG